MMAGPGPDEQFKCTVHTRDQVHYTDLRVVSANYFYCSPFSFSPSPNVWALVIFEIMRSPTYVGPIYGLGPT